MLLAIFPEILRSIAAPVQQFLFGSVITDVEIIRQLLYGLALILIMLYRPNGIWQKPEQLKRVQA
jgi:branched-chain amino acid transport system permease protein